MLNIYWGRENLDKQKFIFDRLAGRTLILVPDQYTLEAEREAFRHLGVSALMDVEILSPSRLGSRILSRQGGGKRSFIDKYGRHMLLHRSAHRLSGELKVFRGMEKKSSFLDSVNNFISEMKQYDCKAEDLKAMAEACREDSYTRRKLEDIYALFEDYERQIEGKYTDSEDYIDLYIGKIKDSELVRGSRVWIYGFDSFAPKAMALMGQLIETADEVNLVITFDDMCRDKDLFALSETVMHNAEAKAAGAGIESRRREIPAEYVFSDKAGAVRHVERELYAMPSFTSSESEGITLVEAAGVYNEAESAASYVIRLVRDKGLRYRDIKVICNDMEGRGQVLKRIFQEYGIQVFVDTKKDILSNSVTQTVISLIDVIIEKYRTESLFKLLKSGFGDLSGEELADLENYGIKYKIKGSMWKKPFRRGKGEYGEEALAALEALRAKAVEPLRALEKVFEAENVGDFIKGFYEYLCSSLKMPEKILSFTAEQELKGLTEFADETKQIWDSLMGILDQICEIMGEEKFIAEEFRDIFTVGLSQVEIGLLPPSEDGLLMGTMQRSRSSRIKALLVVGANEGVLPQEKPSQGLFSPEERELFRETGRELCKVDSVRFMEEKMAVYRNLSAPSRFLWVSCSLSDIEGQQTSPSSIFIKLRELFPEIEITKDVLNGDSPLPLINSSVSGLRHLTSALQEAGEGKEVASEWREALGWFAQKKPDSIASLRKSLSFTNEQEALGKQAAEALFKRNVDEALTLSPSRLERFSRCPFSHLVAYGLKPEERRIYEAAPREIGDIYHRCLMEITDRLTVPGIAITDPASPWMTVSREALDDMVEKKVKEIAESYRDGLFKDSNVEAYRGERVLDICREICRTVVEQVRAGHIRSIIPEASFGRRGTLPPVEVKLADRSVFIEGIIDRVDYLEDDRVKIIDYKTGNENFSTVEAAMGYRLQLMLYLQAACGREEKPAGVFYFKIKEPSVDLSRKEADPETLEQEIRKSFRLDGVMVDDPKVIADIAGEFSGYSQILPVKATKDGIESTGKEGLLSEEDFASLRQAVAEKVEDACRRLSEGRLDIHPMKTKERSACSFCSYRGICRFDTAFEGCSYNIIR